jgi:outer membrane murein-binding lipoprotein Lpp
MSRFIRGIAIGAGLLLATPAWATDYTLTLSGDADDVCTISFSAEAESVEGIQQLENGDITAFACTISEASPPLVLGLSDLQYPVGLDYRVYGGKVNAVDLQTTTSNELQIGTATAGAVGTRWYLFGHGTVFDDPSNVAVIAEVVGQPDFDNDGAPDATDNCVDDPNPDQADIDGDRVGDVCDNCIPLPNRDQKDEDNNGFGDICDALDEFIGPIGGGVSRAEFEALESEVSSLQSAIDDLNARIAALEALGLSEEIQTLKDEAAALEGRLSQIEALTPIAKQLRNAEPNDQ